MKLDVVSRLLILGLKDIPRFGNIVNMRLVADLFSRVQFTEKELGDWEVKFFFDEKTGKTNISWNHLKVEVVDIDLTVGMARIMVEAIERAQELPLGIVSVYDLLKEMLSEEKP
jgi:hypothetical protein